MALKEHAKIVTSNAHAAVQEVVIGTSNAVDGFMQPVQQWLRIVPGANSWFDPDRQRIRAEKIAEHKRQKESERFQKQAAWERLTRPTNRQARLPPDDLHERGTARRP